MLEAKEPPFLLNSSPKRYRRTPKQWAQLIKDYESSGLSQSAFCQQHKIGINSLKKYAKKFSGSQKKSSSKSSFVEIAHKESVIPVKNLFIVELCFPDGMTLTFKEGR